MDIVLNTGIRSMIEEKLYYASDRLKDDPDIVILAVPNTL
jgi:hypothetical protein